MTVRLCGVPGYDQRESEVALKTLLLGSAALGGVMFVLAQDEELAKVVSGLAVRCIIGMALPGPILSIANPSNLLGKVITYGAPSIICPLAQIGLDKSLVAQMGLDKSLGVGFTTFLVTNLVLGQYFRPHAERSGEKGYSDQVEFSKFYAYVSSAVATTLVLYALESNSK